MEGWGMKNNNNLKKLVSILCGVGGLILVVVCQVIQLDILLFLNQMIPVVTIFILFLLCKKDVHFNIMLLFSVWITIYNIFYVILRILNKADLYDVSYRVILQLFIPFIIALFLKRFQDFKEEA
jgi:hypothetical protein